MIHPLLVAVGPAALNLRIAGVLMLVLVPINLWDVPRRFHWKQEMAHLSTLNRQIFQVHAAFICLVLTMFAALALLLTEHLLEPTALARGVLGAIALFWFVRLLVQWFFYDPAIWRGHRFYTAVHVSFTLLWIYLSGAFALALVATFY